MHRGAKVLRFEIEMHARLVHNRDIHRLNSLRVEEGPEARERAAEVRPEHIDPHKICREQKIALVVRADPGLEQWLDNSVSWVEARARYLSCHLHHTIVADADHCRLTHCPRVSAIFQRKDH